VDFADEPEPRTVQVVEQVDVSRGLFIRWSDGSVANIGKVCGRLLTWTDRTGREMLCAPVDACFYRAGTDNDRGGMLLSYYARWKEVGLDRLVRKSQKDAIVSQRRLSCGSIEIVTNWVLQSPRDAAIHVWFKCEAKYIFDPCGSIDVMFSAEASKNTPPLARCGLRWAMPEDIHQVKYFGLGPHEAYDDRLASVYMGVFETTAEAMHTHYTFPQECGRRADPRYVRFQVSQ
jgi:beta-galactosidase